MANPSMSIPDGLLSKIDKIAHERSEPGERVSRSEVVREALSEYVERHEDEVSEWDNPKEATAHE